MSSKDLPWNRLSTTDQQGKRIYLYPTDVKGRWKQRRFFLSFVLMIVFLFLPWIKIGGHQAILLDIPKRKFAIFGLTFWAHDVPMLFFVIIGAIITIAFVTAIWGRLWCGWACPQTVFVEHVFRRIERWVEGDALAQRKLDQSPLTFKKLRKKIFKWSLFLALSSVISHSVLAYFVGTEALSLMIRGSPFQNPTSFLLMTVITGMILFDFGWFREQFCTVVCPYGRFQSILMDQQSAVVAYDHKRGEPRKGKAPSTVHTTPSGDCVNCYRCVQACPTGIDIRRGVQLECIACTACMDACDDVMTRLKKPLGLIRYGTSALFEGKTEAFVPWFERTRAWIYLALLILCIGGLTYTTSHRPSIERTLIRATDFPYQEMPAPSGAPVDSVQILNHFKLDLRNQTFETLNISLSLAPEYQDRGISLVVSNHQEALESGKSERPDLFLQFPKNFLKNGRGSLTLLIVGKKSQTPELIEVSQDIQLVGPLK